ncbi:MAG: SdrD B-like domain-containing protein, partial [Limisphaerales bacterium]
MATYTLDPITGTYVLSADQSFVVSTDQSDYSPGSTVQITATFEPGSTLQLMVGHDIGAGADGIWGTADDVLSYDLLGTGLPWTVTADANGVINTSWFVNPDALGQSFELIATELGPDGTSTGPMATTFFTDSPVPVDLTTTTGTVNNAVFINTTQDPTGTGLIKSFLGIQDSPTESGYNTDGLPTPLDDKNVSSVHTGSVQLFQFTLVNVDGTPYDGLHGPAYREILLDIGQSGNNDSPSTHISLDALQIYIAGLGSLLDTTNQLPATTNGLTAAGATLVYNLDSAGDVSVTLSDHSSGNGALDYRILIPDSLFTDKGATDTSYVYLYADFSNANGSFEEFATGKGSTTPPPGHTGAIDGFKFQDLDGTLTTTEYSTNVLQGWTIVLEDSAHNQIATATTDANGFYTFNNLLDGTYYVHEVQQTGWTELTDASFLQTFQLNVLNGGSLEADFVNFNLIDLSGKKYLDKTGDGITSDDGGLGGIRIFVDLNDNGAFDAATETAVSTLTNSLAGHVGEWSLTGLSSSVIGHNVLEVLPTGYLETVGTAGYPVTGDQTGLDFANFNLIDLSGKKYLDKTGDGITGDDSGLGGVRIFVDLNDN